MASPAPRSMAAHPVYDALASRAAGEGPGPLAPPARGRASLLESLEESMASDDSISRTPEEWQAQLAKDYPTIYQLEDAIVRLKKTRSVAVPTHFTKLDVRLAAATAELKRRHTSQLWKQQARACVQALSDARSPCLQAGTRAALPQRRRRARARASERCAPPVRARPRTTSGRPTWRPASRSGTRPARAAGRSPTTATWTAETGCAGQAHTLAPTKSPPPRWLRCLCSPATLSVCAT